MYSINCNLDPDIELSNAVFVISICYFEDISLYSNVLVGSAELCYKESVQEFEFFNYFQGTYYVTSWALDDDPVWLLVHPQCLFLCVGVKEYEPRSLSRAQHQYTNPCLNFKSGPVRKT